MRAPLLCSLLAGALAASASTAAAGVRAVACSTRGLAVGARNGPGYHVVGLRAAGISCASARSIARQAAEDLFSQRSLSFPDASDLAISQESCGGCVPRTQISIAYPRGSVSVSIAGSAPQGLPAGTPGALTA